MMNVINMGFRLVPNPLYGRKDEERFIHIYTVKLIPIGHTLEITADGTSYEEARTNALYIYAKHLNYTETPQ